LVSWFIKFLNQNYRIIRLVKPVGSSIGETILYSAVLKDGLKFGLIALKIY